MFIAEAECVEIRLGTDEYAPAYPIEAALQTARKSRVRQRPAGSVADNGKVAPIGYGVVVIIAGSGRVRLDN